MSDKLLKVLHPIQLDSIATKELFIRVNDEIPKDFASSCKDEIHVNSGHSPFDKEQGVIHVGLQVSLGMNNEDNLPISMRIEVVGAFTIDTDKFPEDKINAWADQNAPIILFPFVRENSFALTTRCGLPPLILPLVQVPTLENAATKED